MNGENFLDMAILAAVLIGCLFLIGRFIYKTLGSTSSKSCSGCPYAEGCDKPEKLRPGRKINSKPS